MLDKNKHTLKKWHIVFLIIIGLAFIILNVWQYHWPEANVELRGQKLHVLVAKDFYHQYRGLGKRDSLGAYDGMLFAFNFADRQGIVMRDMRFPLDIVWLNQGEVIDYIQNVQLEPGVEESQLSVYYPRQDADMVLELPAGWVQNHGLKIGEVLKAVKD